jgi:hypothetical protein
MGDIIGKIVNLLGVVRSERFGSVSNVGRVGRVDRGEGEGRGESEGRYFENRKGTSERVVRRKHDSITISTEARRMLEKNGEDACGDEPK